jgi:cyclopropane fatty-acyl-phospholipid synthase-like methyltransferase
MGTRVPPENVFGARRVLDLGCGCGVWTAEAVKEWKNVRLVGVDLTDVFPSTVTQTVWIG